MLSIKEKLSFKGLYEIERKNVKTGKIDVWNTHNLITDFYASQMNSASDLLAQCRAGNGTSEPVASSSSLTSDLWGVSRSSLKRETSVDHNSRIFTCVYVFPANSSYVGTISEIGIGTGENSLITHALIKDSEGNPITIEKTFLDEITVTVKLTVSRNDLMSSRQVWNIRTGALGDAWSFMGLWVGGIEQDLHSPSTCSLSKCFTPDLRPFQFAGINKNPSYDSNSKTWSGNYEWGSNDGNIGYVNSILFGRNTDYSSWGCYSSSALRILFPNAELFPVKRIENLNLGTGDGVTTDFVPPIPLWVDDTDVVKKDGVSLRREIDYLVDAASNLSQDMYYTLGNFAIDFDCDMKAYSNCRGFLFGTNSGYDNNWGDVQTSPALTIEKPMTITYDVESSFSSKVNRIKLGSWYVGNGDFPSGTKLVFSYSTNGESFAQFGEISGTGSFIDTTMKILNEAIIGVKYVKIELILPDGSNQDDYKNRYVYLSQPDSFFGYVGEYAIRFITPPEEGSILTIDLSIDRPWKSSDYVIQFNPVVSF